MNGNGISKKTPILLQQFFIFYYNVHKQSGLRYLPFTLSLQKHPHVIFEARTKANKGCANSGNLDSWRLSRRTKHLSAGIIDEIHPNGAGRYKRDVREATKYIETAIIVDKAMFEKRNGSTRAEVIHDAIQVANIADLVSSLKECNNVINLLCDWQNNYSYKFILVVKFYDTIT